MVGVLLSLSLHVLAVAALIATAVGQDGRRASPIRADAAPAINVVLLSEAGPRAATKSGAARSPVAEPTPRTPSLASARPTSASAEVPPPVAPSRASPPGGGAPAMAAAATTSAPVDPALGEDYRRRLFEHVASYRRPPALARGERSSGVVLLQLAVGREGEVLSVSVAASSGVADLDDEAVATVWRARPLPPIPSALPARLAVTLPVSFDPKRPGGAGGG